MITRDLDVDAGGTVRFGDDVGQDVLLRNLTVQGTTEVAADRLLSALQTISLGAVEGESDDVAMLTLTAENGVRFGGNVGETVRLAGLVVDSARVTFDADGEQVVRTGAGGISLDADGLPAPPETSTIGKSGGNLDLVTDGVLDVGPNHKLTVEGVARLEGATVRVGDVSAQEIQVVSDDLQVRRRSGGSFLVPGVGPLPDLGTDWVANVVSTTSAPTAVGSGADPVFVTASGTVDGAGVGPFRVSSLTTSVTASALVDASGDGPPTFYDLGLSVADPGDETEPPPPPVVPLLPALRGQEASAGSARPPGIVDLLGFLQCTTRQAGGSAPRTCAGDEGSPLDSERGDDVARRYARLFGDAPEARAARALLAGDPNKEERPAVLRDLATLLAQLRLLGMEPPAYEQLRDELLDAARGDTPREELLADVRAHARGIPL
jgi:hypothetical protein